MTLDEYTKAHSITDQFLAVRLGKDRSLVSRYRRGEVRPPLEIMAKIEEVTEGSVCFRDWMPAADAEERAT